MYIILSFLYMSIIQFIKHLILIVAHMIRSAEEGRS